MLIKLSFWLILPSLFLVVFSSSSFAAGMVAVATVGLFITVIVGRPLKISKLYIYLIFISVFSILVSFLLFGQIPNLKHLSLVAMIVVGVGASFFLKSVTEPFLSKEMSHQIKLLYLIIVLIGISGLMAPLRIGNYALASHPVFPFFEPSHFALVYGPISCMALVISGAKVRTLICFTTFALSLAFPNTTLLLIGILISLINFSFLFLLVIFSILIFLFFILISTDLVFYFSDRLIGDNAENISRLVYIQGWENMFSAISSTFGLGIGFQNLGNESPGPASVALSLLTESGLNRNDGGFLLAKVGGEFGLIGVVGVIILLLISISAGELLRKRVLTNSIIHDLTNPLPLCVVYTIIIEFIIRGVGYFSPTLFLAIFALPSAISILRNHYHARSYLKYFRIPSF